MQEISCFGFLSSSQNFNDCGKYNDYAEKIARQFKSSDIRVELDSRNEKIGYKIREAQLQKVPYISLGKRNEFGTISSALEIGELEADVEEFIQKIKEDKNKVLPE